VPRSPKIPDSIPKLLHRAAAFALADAAVAGLADAREVPGRVAAEWILGAHAVLALAVQQSHSVVVSLNAQLVSSAPGE